MPAMEYTLMGSIKKLINENLKRPMYLWNNHSNICGVIGRFSNNISPANTIGENMY